MGEIEEVKFLVGKTLEEVQTSETLSKEVDKLGKKAYGGGDASITALGIGIKSLQSYLTCLGHIPIPAARIEQNPVYIDSKCDEAINYGTKALDTLEISFQGIVTLMDATAEARGKAGPGDTSILGRTQKAKAYFKELQIPNDSRWGIHLGQNLNRGFEHAARLTSGFILTHTDIKKEPARISEFIPRLRGTIALLKQTKDKPADHISVIIETAASRVQKEDIDMLIDVEASLIFGTQHLEEIQPVSNELVNLLSQAKANSEELFNEL